MTRKIVAMGAAALFVLGVTGATVGGHLSSTNTGQPRVNQPATPIGSTALATPRPGVPALPTAQVVAAGRQRGQAFGGASGTKVTDVAGTAGRTGSIKPTQGSEN
jgi:uncharacterized iron-regulated membrane protein